MSEEDAIILLSRCKLLSQKLITSGCHYRLTGGDFKVLQDLRQMKKTGTAINKALQSAAGLSTSELMVLYGTLSVEEWQIGQD